MDQPAENVIIQGSIRLKRKLGSGAFGQIWLGEHLPTKIEYAVKLEHITISRPQLWFEYRIYKYLTHGQIDYQHGIPNVHLFTTEGNYNILIMDLLGSSLEDLFVSCGKKFTLKTILMIALQMLQRIRRLHEMQFLHRDIKPDNFLIGRGCYSHLIHMIDYGLAKRYIKNNEHIPLREGKNLTGTGRYASIATHQGYEQGRRDDLEGMMYVLIYFLRGSLPWQGLQAATKAEKYNKIRDKKIATSIDLLCQGLPVEFILCLQHIRDLAFTEKPDYKLIHQHFTSMMTSQNYIYDYQYDWSVDNVQSYSKPAIEWLEDPIGNKDALNQNKRNISIPDIQTISSIQFDQDNLQFSDNNAVEGRNRQANLLNDQQTQQDNRNHRGFKQMPHNKKHTNKKG